MSQEYKHQVTVEFEDVDSYQIAHHARLIAYLERARVRYFNSLGYDLANLDFNPVLYHLDIKFKKTVKLLDELSIFLTVGEVKTFLLELNYRIQKSDQLVAKAKTTLAFVDSQTKELIPVPSIISEITKDP